MNLQHLFRTKRVSLYKSSQRKNGPQRGRHGRTRAAMWHSLVDRSILVTKSVLFGRATNMKLMVSPPLSVWVGSFPTYHVAGGEGKHQWGCFDWTRTDGCMNHVRLDLFTYQNRLMWIRRSVARLNFPFWTGMNNRGLFISGRERCPNGSTKPAG
jgi:hypothetical protein